MSDDDTHHSRKWTRRSEGRSSMWISTSDTANANFGTGSINIGGSQIIFYDGHESLSASGLNTRPRGTTRTVSESPQQPMPQEHNERGIAEETKGPPHTAHYPQEAGLGVPGSQRTGLNTDSTHADVSQPIFPSREIKPIVGDEEGDASSDGTLDYDEAGRATTDSVLIPQAKRYVEHRKPSFENEESLTRDPLFNNTRRYFRHEGDESLVIDHLPNGLVSLGVKKLGSHHNLYSAQYQGLDYQGTGYHLTSAPSNDQATSGGAQPASVSRNANFQGQGIQNISGKISIGGVSRVNGVIQHYATESDISTNDPTARALAQQNTNAVPGGFVTSSTSSDFLFPGDITIDDDGLHTVSRLGNGAVFHGNVQFLNRSPHSGPGGETSASRR